MTFPNVNSLVSFLWFKKSDSNYVRGYNPSDVFFFHFLSHSFSFLLCPSLSFFQSPFLSQTIAVLLNFSHTLTQSLAFLISLFLFYSLPLVFSLSFPCPHVSLHSFSLISPSMCPDSSIIRKACCDLQASRMRLTLIKASLCGLSLSPGAADWWEVWVCGYSSAVARSAGSSLWWFGIRCWGVTLS